MLAQLRRRVAMENVAAQRDWSGVGRCVDAVAADLDGIGEFVENRAVPSRWALSDQPALDAWLISRGGGRVGGRNYLIGRDLLDVGTRADRRHPGLWVGGCTQEWARKRIELVEGR